MPDHRSAAKKTIHAKRNQVSAKRLRQRAAAGEDIDGSRAIVRIGQMNTRILTGQEDLSTWEDEELKRGQRRDKNGRFQGKPPLVVPKALHDELIRRTMSRSHMILVEAVEDAATAVVEIMNGFYTEGEDDPKAKDRLKAAEMIMNRVLGKEPIKVEIAAFKAKYEEAFEAMIVPDDDTVIDVDSWEADDGG